MNLYDHDRDVTSFLNVNVRDNKPILLICTSADALLDGTPTGAW